MLKRLTDLSTGVVGLIVLSPVMAVVAALIAMVLGRPVLYIQTRIGLNEEAFTLYKFRTMTESTADDGSLLSDEQRLTVFGRFLRATSLDELPQLINIAKGEMSLVGPRPLLPEYLQHYTPEESQRHLVRPGITGWAQINGRNTISWEDRFVKDLWYVRNAGLLLDFKIILLTIWNVVLTKGIGAENQATMPKFSRPKGLE